MASPTAAHQRYRNTKGSIVPGVTTVIGLLAKPFLVPWAWKLGMAGEDMNKVRDLAASIGTAAHYLIECFLEGERPDMQHFTQFVSDEALKIFEAFKEWHSRQEVETLVTEEQVVSERWQFGGCIDWVARWFGKVTMFDFKTSKGIYDEYRIQLAAYEQAWNELHPDLEVEQIVVLHLDKEQYTVTQHPFTNLAVEFEIFKHLRAIYTLQKRTDPKRNRSQSNGYRRAGRLAQAARRR